MEFNKWVADLEVGDEIEGFYILKTAQIKTSNNGKPLLAASVADRSGVIDAKCWDYAGAARKGLPLLEVLIWAEIGRAHV